MKRTSREKQKGKWLAGFGKHRIAMAIIICLCTIAAGAGPWGRLPAAFSLAEELSQEAPPLLYTAEITYQLNGGKYREGVSAGQLSSAIMRKKDCGYIVSLQKEGLL